ncbi:MAG: succinyl-diaminopimelate desuccinylase [Alphaproteobacteria bacterium]|jgi:succinyl-diaminopimelate desuccinylase|nr:succinyl-diaminopimelate desuccinylase [Alphaproteobacteria bacterium]
MTEVAAFPQTALPPDPIALARALIRCPSVTPADAGALDVLADAVRPLGFRATRLPFQAPGTERVDNLWARRGTGGPLFVFAGHTDVVPPGDPAAWSRDPFAGEVADGILHGRGACDMKGAVAAFAAGIGRFLARHDGRVPGSIGLLITGDEEGPAINGTRPVLDWLAGQGVRPDACLVGEPTCPGRLGDMIKIGRRGSLVGRLTVDGVQGHTAYPHQADNPVNRLVAMLAAITAEPLDAGTDHFDPSNLEITTVDVGNPATNVIPARARATFNIRFNDRHTGESLIAWLRRSFDAVGGDYDLDVRVSGEAFLTPPGALSDLVAGAVAARTGVAPVLSTTGGTSDARFIKDHCPVVEFGLVNQTIHKVDEQVAVADIEVLSDVYADVLDGFFFAGKG